jgi:hypothetical protein
VNYVVCNWVLSGKTGQRLHCLTNWQARKTNVTCAQLDPIAMQLMHLNPMSVAWIAFACIIIYFTVLQVYLFYDNFAIVGGTDDVMEWWFYLATPLDWSLIIVRAIQNLLQDIQRCRRGEAFIMQAPLKA